MSVRLWIAAVATVIMAIAVYATAIEPLRLRVTGIDVRPGALTQVLSGRKVALLGDLHFGRAGEQVADDALRLLREVRPDLILLSGDYVEWGSRGEAYERVFDFLARLEAPLGVYAVLGDADCTYSRKSCEFCHQPGSTTPATRHRVAFLMNEERVINLPQGSIRIIGMDPYLPRSLGTAGARLHDLLAGETPTILLSHSSVVYKEIDPAQEVLALSGDTHGGQVWMPRWFWRLTHFKPDPDHMHGYFRDGRKSLVVTRGVGTSHLRFRLGSPPEIVILVFPGGAK